MPNKQWDWQDLKESVSERARRLERQEFIKPSNLSLAQLSNMEAHKARCFNAATFYGGIAVLIAFIAGFVLGVSVR